MANTYVLIASTTISSTPTYGVTFSSIPQTYTDLVVRMSSRINTNGGVDDMQIYFNNTTGVYSTTRIRGNGSTVTSGRTGPSSAYEVVFGINNESTTSNTFSNVEIYIPNYTSTSSKPNSVFGVTEQNATAAAMALTAGLTTSTSAISSIKIEQGYGFSQAIGSTYYLYGIKNS